MHPLKGFNVFYYVDCEGSFVAPKTDMTVEDFVAEANRKVRDEWCLASDYEEAGYPWDVSDVETGICSFDPEFTNFEGEKGVWVLSDRCENPIECWVIHLD